MHENDFIERVANTHPRQKLVVRKIIKEKINPKLIKYINQNILPEYDQNEHAHDRGHAEYVAHRSLNFAHNFSHNLDYAMVYTIAAYHDIKHHVNAKEHEKLGSEALLTDRDLREYFNPKQIETMAEAVFDHRSSIDSEPRTIYGKIICSADRTTTVRNAMQATYHYRAFHCPENNLQEIITEAYEHIKSKYGPNGYAIYKNYFPDPEFENFLLDIAQAVSSLNMFQKIFIKVNQLEKADLSKTITENNLQP